MNYISTKTSKRDLSLFCDLHCHTTYSDGHYTPLELIKEAKNIGLGGVAITDHDCVEKIEEAIEAAKAYKIELLPGTELSIRFDNLNLKCSIHILIFFNHKILKDNDFVSTIKFIKNKVRGEEFINSRLKAINIFFGPESKEAILSSPLTMGEVKKANNIATRRHLMLALHNRGIFDESIINKMIGNDSPAYIPAGIELKEAFLLLKKFPLVKILAHPGKGESNLAPYFRHIYPSWIYIEKMLPYIVDIGLDGIELFSPAHTLSMCKKIKRKLKEFDLSIATGGSDFHGDGKIGLGASTVRASVLNNIQRILHI